MKKVVFELNIKTTFIMYLGCIKISRLDNKNLMD